MTVSKITSKKIVSNIFNALDDDNYVKRKIKNKIIFAIFYIFYGVRTIMFKKTDDNSFPI